jgi:hypothetical protein
MGGVCAALWFCAGCWRSSHRQLLGVTAEQTQNVHIQMPQQTGCGALTAVFKRYIYVVVVLLLPHHLPLHLTLHRHIWVGAPPPPPPPHLLFFLCAGWRVRAGGSYPDQFNSCRQSVNLLVHQQSSFSLSGLCWATTTRTVCCTVRVQIVCIIMCGVNSCAKLLIHTCFCNSHSSVIFCNSTLLSNVPSREFGVCMGARWKLTASTARQPPREGIYLPSECAVGLWDIWILLDYLLLTGPTTL